MTMMAMTMTMTAMTMTVMTMLITAMLTAMLEMTATAKRKMEDVDIRGKRIGKWSQPLKIISLPCQVDVLRFHQQHQTSIVKFEGTWFYI